MAIYHMQAKVVSRGSGRSAVAASAYMSCSRMYNDYDGIQHDYTRKQGLIYQEVMLPPIGNNEGAILEPPPDTPLLILRNRHRLTFCQAA